MLATEPPESRGPVRGDQVWVKFPSCELLALEINDSDRLFNLLEKASQRSGTIGPIGDVYATVGGNPLSLQSLYMLKNVQEGSYLRIHYRLRGGAPKRGRPGRLDCFSFVEGRCSYGTRRLFSHATTRVCCTVRGSVDHVPEECVYYGGGSYDPQLDPNALKEAERAAARNRTSTPPLKPAEPSHHPPKSIWNKHHPWSDRPNRQSDIWYGSDDEEQEEWSKKACQDPQSPPKAVRAGARLCPRLDGSGKRPATPPTSYKS